MRLELLRDSSKNTRGDAAILDSDIHLHIQVTSPREWGDYIYMLMRMYLYSYLLYMRMLSLLMHTMLASSVSVNIALLRTLRSLTMLTVYSLV